MRALAPRLKNLRTIWRPRYTPHFSPQRPRAQPVGLPFQPSGQGPAAVGDVPERGPSYGGRDYVAAEGLVWELHAGAMRTRAAQLQHRLPCWGYVLQVC